MHKQELDLKYKIKKYKKNKQLFNKVNFFNKTLLKLTQIKNLVNCYKINIRATSNNVFCTLSDIKRKKTLLLGYSGKYNIKTSKRSLKFSSKYIIESFLKEINKYVERIKKKTLLLIRLLKKLITKIFII